MATGITTHRGVAIWGGTGRGEGEDDDALSAHPSVTICHHAVLQNQGGKKKWQNGKNGKNGRNGGAGDGKGGQLCG